LRGRISQVARATGYSETADHQFLTADLAVQHTRFANGVTVTVNFSDKPFKTCEQIIVPAGAFYVAGLAGR